MVRPTYRLSPHYKSDHPEPLYLIAYLFSLHNKPGHLEPLYSFEWHFMGQ